MWLHSGSGRWEVLNSDGPVLGLLENADFDCVRGQLARGDGLLLFTDGLVETAQRDISLGMDKLAGLGERLVQQGFDGGAKRLIDSMEQTNDDRALVVVHRRSGSRAVRDHGSRCGTMVPALAKENARGVRGCSSMVEPQSSKLMTRVRFPSSALRSLLHSIGRASWRGVA